MTASVGILGSGSFGRGLATAIERNGHQVVHWGRQPRPSPSASITTTDNLADIGPCTLIFIAVPSKHIPALAPALGAYLDGRHLLVHISRGLIGDELETVSRHLTANTAARRVGCLAGPLNPEVFSEGRPGGGIIGSQFHEVAQAVRQVLEGPELRLYDTTDEVGVEVAAALVGLLAMQAGFCLERQVSPSAMAVLMSRGLAEAARVGVRLGARAETFQGLAGTGDLMAALGGDERAEVLLGRALARAIALEEAGKLAGAHIEGLTIAGRVARFAESAGIRAPICSTTAAVIEGRVDVDRALTLLMER